MKCDLIDSSTREKIGECTLVPTLDENRCLMWIGSDVRHFHTKNFKNGIFDL